MGDANGQGGTIVVLTALDVEYRAAREHLVALQRRSDKGTLFEVGYLNGTPWRVALAEIGEGNQGAAVITERAVALFHPRAVVFAGVAGALKDDIQLGDVVVATQVYDYHGGKEENGAFLARPRVWAADHELEQLARYVRREGSWVQPLPESGSGRRPDVHLKPVAAGEVVLNSARSPLREQLRQHYQDAAAIEMESAGVAKAAHLNAALPTLVVRGISDRADGGKHHADRAGLQQVAARNAAAVAFSVIRELPEEDGEPHRETPAGGAWESMVFASTATDTVESRAAGATVWCGGEEVACGDYLYLLHDELLDERPSSDYCLIARQALARQLKPEPLPHTRYVWLRQAEARYDTAAETAARPLARENGLLKRLGRQSAGLPRAGLITSQGRTATLALPWPTSRASSGPCPTLGTALDRREPLGPGSLRRLLTGLAGLCTTLVKLHRRGATHRHLMPSGIIELDDGRFVLRDLGLAAHIPEPGEGPDPYRAPEQRRRALRGKTGSWTDAYQLGALAYHLIAAHPPTPDRPLPLRAHLPDIPKEADRAILAALARDPADRPTLNQLQVALRGARDDLR
ncbi:phosphorylase family protein [Streptomyces sp. 8N616]|uniref:phosphorylase family protein n=1 Tax=Streptomyces sp. 8N616 TaxID=3457414 RepID=UPI003FCFC37A